MHAARAGLSAGWAAKGGTSERTSADLSCQFSLVKREHAVHQHVLDSDRRLRRIFVGGAIVHGLRIEDGDVGEPSGTQLAPLAQVDTLCGERGEFTDRF